MVFGIDLGTTNSLIGVGDTLITGLVSSSVDVVKKTQVGRDVINENVVSSYKTDMSMGESGKLSIACSAIILKDLVRRCSEVFDEVKDVIISVPAYFSTSQREAVYKAGELAGLRVVSLINEPTAAAIYICKDIKDLIVVYDLGGGTFDVSIVDSRNGNYAVVATDGIVLGGDDLDIAIMEEVFKELKIPIRFRTSLMKKTIKSRICTAKEEIQKDGITSVVVDMHEFGDINYILTEEKYKSIVREVFEPTFIRTQNIIGTNIPSYEKPKIVFIGGSANCPYLKQMLKEEIDVEEIESEASPDFAVALGVARYADLYNKGLAYEMVEDVTKRLCIKDRDGKSLTVIEKNEIIPCRRSIIVKNSTTSDKLSLKLYQGDSIVAEKNEYIGTLIYNYEREVPAHEGIVEVTVEVAHDGVISLSAVEVLYDEDYRQVIQLSAR